MSPTSSTATNLRLHGTNLPVVRSVFVILTLATLIFFGMGVPLSYDNIVKTLSYDIETLTALDELGISNELYATYQISLTILVAIGFGVAGIIIYWYKSDEWLALLMAFTLIGNGADAFDALKRMETIAQFRIPVHFIQGMVLLGLLLACYLFPDGKFQKRWMVYLAGFWAIWLMASTFWASLPMNAFDRTPNGRLIYLLYLLGVLGTGIYAQIYRYRNTDNPVKREQLKWLVFGVVVSILIGIGTLIFDILFDRMNSSDHARLIERMITQALATIGQLTAPVAIVFSMLRYRLYDIELVINRSLIFGLLTIVLAVVFGSVLLGLQNLFSAITGNENPPTVGIVVATLAVSSLFNPTLKISRRFVNKKIFGIDFDFSEVARQSAKIEKVLHLPSHAIANIDGYTGLELIARGGMGEIYKARHPNLNRTIAIKVLSSYFKEDADFNKRFAREAETMAQLKHPNIITIHDYGEQDGLPYIVMEYLTGDTLSQLLQTRTRLSLEESLPLLRDLASALDYAHAQNIVHRDIKPSNVIIEPITIASGRMQRAILMDFGIARFVGERTKLTITGDLLGTADYISPEQIHGAINLDGRADQYSFAVLVYLMLTGKKPFDRNNTWAMIKAHLEEPPPDPCEVVPMSESAAKAIMKAMAKKPEDRFASVGEFIETLGK